MPPSKDLPRVTVLQSVGILLIVVSGMGFVTVADDLRHVGELVGVGAIGIAGLVLAVSPCRSRQK